MQNTESRVRLIFDIQVEHLDEAEFLLEMWMQCNDSPTYTLDRLLAGPEQRLLARIAGLQVGGERTLDELLLPAIAEADDDPWRAAAAALAVLDGAGLEACSSLLASLARCEGPEGEEGLSWALGRSARAGLVPWIGQGIEALEGPALRGRVRALIMHRVDAGRRLLAWIGAGDLQLVGLAAELARHTSDPEVHREIARGLHGAAPPVRWTASESRLIRGLPGAWEGMCQEAVRPQVPARRRATLGWLAMLGDAKVHAQLLASMSTPSADTLWALGLAGRVQAVDVALELLESEALARLAGEVVCTVAGLDIRDDSYWLDAGVVPVDAEPEAGLPPLAEDDLEASLVPLAEGALRLPNAAAVRAWWMQQRGRFVPEQRYSRGRPLDGDQLLRDLREAPTRLRHARALELAARTSGAAQLETRAFAWVQGMQLDALAARVPSVDFRQGRAFAA